MAGSPTFAVVSEGPSDHRVLRALLAAYFADPDIVVHQLQPEGATPGGWTEVLRYCGSERFRAAIPIHDFVVVQIDTDVCEEPGFDVPRRSDGRERSPAELVLAARERLVAAIGPAVHGAAGAKVLFAVCVDAIECWLLPLYFQDSRRAKTTGCLGALNRALSAHLTFSIDPADKRTLYYDKLLRAQRLHKRRTLEAIADGNPSLTIFLRHLDDRFPGHAILRPDDDLPAS